MFIFIRGFRSTFKWRGSYPRGLVSGAGGGGLVSKSLRYLNMLLHD